MSWKWIMKVFLCLVLLRNANPSPAAHPLVSDDTGTQGKGNFQLEMSGQCDQDKENIGGVFVKTTGGLLATTLSYGIAENVDLVLGMPYPWCKTEENKATTYDENGIGDVIYSINKNFDADLGVKYGLDSSEADTSLMAGITFKF